MANQDMYHTLGVQRSFAERRLLHRVRWEHIMHCHPIANDKLPLENGHAANGEERSEISRGGVYVDGTYRRCISPLSLITRLDW